MQNIEGFQRLKIWQRAHVLVLAIYKTSVAFPSEERFGLTNQARRSSASICANIAEGYKKSPKDFMRYLDIAQGSLEETKYHLILSRDLDYLAPSAFHELFDLANEVGKMLTGLKNTIRSANIHL